MFELESLLVVGGIGRTNLTRWKTLLDSTTLFNSCLMKHVQTTLVKQFYGMFLFIFLRTVYLMTQTLLFLHFSGCLNLSPLVYRFVSKSYRRFLKSNVLKDLDFSWIFLEMFLIRLSESNICHPHRWICNIRSVHHFSGGSLSRAHGKELQAQLFFCLLDLSQPFIFSNINHHL